MRFLEVWYRASQEPATATATDIGFRTVRLMRHTRYRRVQ